MDPGSCGSTRQPSLSARRDDALLRLALGDRLGTASGGPTPDLPAEVRHHAWVQVAWGAEWMDEDPTLQDAQPGQTLTSPTSTPATLPVSDDKTVTIEVLDQTLQAGRLAETSVLTHTFDAASASPSEIFLYFQPQLAGLGGNIEEALGSATSYLPVLLVNGDALQGASFPVKPGKDSSLARYRPPTPSWPASSCGSRSPARACLPGRPRGSCSTASRRT